MHRLLMVGFTHRGTPAALLEALALTRDRRLRLLGDLRDAGYVEAVVLSTCSRTEVYAGSRLLTSAGANGLVDLLARQVGRSPGELQRVVEVRTGRAVARHLFRVASGLHSRVIGEGEIQGQVRTAFLEAQTAGLTGGSLEPLFQAALGCGRQVRERTTLGAHGRSLARRAVELGLGSMSTGREPVIVVVGSGQMATKAVEHLRRLGREPRVVARHLERAALLVSAARVAPLTALPEAVADADLLICATAADRPIVTEAQVRDALAGRQRTLTVVDLSMPRNVDPAVGRLPGVELVDLDGMNDDPARDAALATAVQTGSAIVEAATRRYLDSVAARDVGAVIAALRRRVEATCLAELAALSPPDVDAADLARAAHRLAGKIAHRPTVTARAAAASGDTALLSTLCHLFDVRLPDAPLAVAG